MVTLKNRWITRTITRISFALLLGLSFTQGPVKANGSEQPLVAQTATTTCPTPTTIPATKSTTPPVVSYNKEKLAKDVVLGIVFRILLVLAWNNSYTQHGVTEIKSFLLNLFAQQNIPAPTGFVDTLLHTIGSSLSQESLKPSGASHTLAKAVAYVYGVATNPIIYNIWFEITYAVLTTGFTATFAPQALAYRFGLGVFFGIISNRITERVSATMLGLSKGVGSLFNFFKRA